MLITGKIKSMLTCNEYDVDYEDGVVIIITGYLFLQNCQCKPAKYSCFLF